VKLRALTSRLLLTILVVFASITVWAGNGHNKKPPHHPAKQMTDAAGRVHVRPTPQITVAQRKAAAQQRKARAKAAQTRKAEVQK